MEKHCNEAKQAYGYTRLQYEKEKNSREEIEEQFESERIAHEKTKAELGGRVDNEKCRNFSSSSYQFGCHMTMNIYLTLILYVNY